jgi:hypothetical protein
MSHDYSGTVTITVDTSFPMGEVDLDVTATYYDCPARIAQRAEDSHPDESYLDVESVIYANGPRAGHEYETELTEAQEAEVIEKLLDQYEAAREDAAEVKAEMRREAREER